MAGSVVNFSFCVFMDTGEVEVHKTAKRERAQYPVIFTKLAWSIKHLFYGIPFHAFLSLFVFTFLFPRFPKCIQLEESELHNFVSILLINRLLFSKYSGANFSAFIANFISKIVQNTKTHVYFLMCQSVFVNKVLFRRYKTMNIKTKGNG